MRAVIVKIDLFQTNYKPRGKKDEEVRRYFLFVCRVLLYLK